MQITYNKSAGNIITIFIFQTKIHAFGKLPEAEKEKIRAILFIMDKFSISLEAYHELTQKDHSLPRTYLVEGCQASLDSKWKTTRAPGDNPGAELPFKDLLKQEVEKHVSFNNSIRIRYNDSSTGTLSNTIRPTLMPTCILEQCSLQSPKNLGIARSVSHFNYLYLSKIVHDVNNIHTSKSVCVLCKCHTCQPLASLLAKFVK